MVPGATNMWVLQEVGWWDLQDAQRAGMRAGVCLAWPAKPSSTWTAVVTVRRLVVAPAGGAAAVRLVRSSLRRAPATRCAGQEHGCHQAAQPRVVSGHRRVLSGGVPFVAEAAEAYAWTAFVSSRICCERSSNWRFCRSSSCTICHCWLAATCRAASARFWLIITNVERK